MTFKKIGYDDISRIDSFLRSCDYGLCDYTPLVLILWSDFYDYSYAVENGVLFIRQRRAEKTEYLLPVTDETEGALKVLAEYCRRNGEDLNLVAVPEKYKERVERVLNRPLTDMGESDGDYVYAASDLVNLVGRKYNGQRNHLNRFKRDYPSAVFRRLKPEDKDALREFLAEYHVNDTSDTYLYDRKAVRTFIENFDKFSFLCGAVFLDKKILAFSVGDVIGDTLFVHIEKCLRAYSGIGETINHDFVSEFVGDGVKYVNREEDMGDEGLRKAKLSYFPTVRKKYQT
ncbi:MAG: phosphatidylglycerol lysyltransferase domain-containing protein [Clostridiales bacterium]|nr:phosphatidylglycerol lysyltransferase domain-containing protein [Clostridiales bacterium]MDY5726116.1 phosphatidylglycerol lysyltransferase domain-containing protein [Eubacteriales bacterium]